MNKKIMMLIGFMVLPVSAFSATTDNVVLAFPATTNQQPDLYDFTGTNLKISYSTTGIDGKARFSYKNGKTALNFSGDEIRTVETEIGTLVSVTVSMTVDTGSTSFSVLIPKVNLDSKLKSTVKAQGFLTEHKFSMIPNFSTGQRDIYKVYPLTGTAKFVVF